MPALEKLHLDAVLASAAFDGAFAAALVRLGTRAQRYAIYPEVHVRLDDQPEYPSNVMLCGAELQDRYAQQSPALATCAACIRAVAGRLREADAEGGDRD